MAQGRRLGVEQLLDGKRLQLGLLAAEGVEHDLDSRRMPTLAKGDEPNALQRPMFGLVVGGNVAARRRGPQTLLGGFGSPEAQEEWEGQGEHAGSRSCHGVSVVGGRNSEDLYGSCFPYSFSHGT